jgi:hypothetical protein
MKNLSFKTVAPHLTAILLFLAITFVYFSPLLEGKKIQQSDIVHFQGVSKELKDFREKTGQEALWTNSLFGGMPAYQISVRYTANLIANLDKVFTLGLPVPANYLFLYFIGFYLLLLVLGVNPWLSMAGSTGFGLSSFFLIVIEAGHNSQAHAIGYIGFVLAGILLALRGKYILGGILTAVFLSLELNANHPQITYYMVLLAVIFGIFEFSGAVRTKTLPSWFKSIGVIMVAVLFAFLTNITSLWATYEYGKYTIRGKSELTTEKENRTSGLDKDYITRWSYGIGETMTLLIPNVYGGTYQKLTMNSEIAKALDQNGYPARDIMKDQQWPMYWGSQPFTSGPVYVGSIIVFLFILGLFIVKGPLKWWLLTGTVLSIMLAWGHNFMAFTDLFLNYLPGYNKFRAVTMTLVIAEITMPILGMLAIREFLNPENDRKKLFRSLQIAFAITGGICLLFALLPGMFFDFHGISDKSAGLPDFMTNALVLDRKSLLVTDAFRSFAFITLTAVLLWAVLYNKLKVIYAYPVLIGLILIDLYAVDKRYVNNDSFVSKSKVETPFEPTPADQQILQDNSLDYRVFNATIDPTMDAGTSYFHKSLGGYHGAKLRRYQELIDNQISKNNMQVFDMLNTKYVIVPGENKTQIAQQNPGALGNAWFVKGYKLVNNADEEINALTGFNAKDTAIIDKVFAADLKGFSGGRDSLDAIKLIDYQPNNLVYTSRSKNGGLAVFSEIYYPKGWVATIDNNPATIFRVNYVLRAMVIPAGDHKVVFNFHPKVYFVGEKISLASSIVLIVFIVLFGGFAIRRAMKPKA